MLTIMLDSTVDYGCLTFWLAWGELNEEELCWSTYKIYIVNAYK